MTPPVSPLDVNRFTPAALARVPARRRQLLERRRAVLGDAAPLLYRRPVHPVRGEGSWLHETVVDYAEDLLSTFPAGLDRIAFTCTGSEANDLAVRLARQTTGPRGVHLVTLGEPMATGITAAHARGRRLRAGLRTLQARHPYVTDIRGAGLFTGIEFGAPDRPAPQTATAVVDGLRERGVLASTAGAHGNVLKIRPPLSITTTDIDHFLAATAEVLAEVAGP